MLKVDHHKKIVYEGYGVDMDKVPHRCRDIALEDVEALASSGYRYIHLSEWVLFNEKEQLIALGLSYRSKADAEYALDDHPGYVTRRVVDVLTFL